MQQLLTQEKRTAMRRPLLGSQTKNHQKSRFTKFIWDKNLQKLKNLKCFEKRTKNQLISIDLGGERSKVIQYGQQ